MAANQTNHFEDWQHAMLYYYESDNKEQTEFCFSRAKDACHDTHTYLELTKTCLNLNWHEKAVHTYAKVANIKHNDISLWESVIRNYKNYLHNNPENPIEIKKALAYAYNQWINIEGEKTFLPMFYWKQPNSIAN